MDDVRSPIYAAEPYEESQGRDSEVASSDVFAAFYRDMERKEIVERKLSKRSKSNSGTSIWARKLSLKRSATAAPVRPPEHKPHPRLDTDPRNERRRDTMEEDREINLQDEANEKSDWVPAMNSPRSIVPDSLKELPASYNKEAWDAVPSHYVKYHIHDPVGPRWYKNHHLLHPSSKTPAARPPSFFSPSFPPMASSASQEHSADATRMPGPSRTPSNSPLPTPNSSQTRVVDANGKPRTRKTSQTAHDNVDLLDVTDPWGTNWHHHSPYDVGLGNGPVSIDVQDALHTRSRRSSLTAQSRRKTITPSPLSQSTSAVHLHHPPDTGAHIPRKLSKRRTPVLGSIFGGTSEDPGPKAVSLPISPVEVTTRPSVDHFQASELPKRMSVAPSTGPPVSSSQSTTSKKEKRGSVLGRLVKKFSVLRKAAPTHPKGIGREDDWQHVNSGETSTNKPLSYGGGLDKQFSPEKQHSDALKRVPPPSIDGTSETKPDKPPKEADRSSSFSFEAPFSMGRLTIANPDSPRSGDTTPVQPEIPLPHDRFEHTHTDTLHTLHTSSSPPRVSHLTHLSGKLTLDNPPSAASVKGSSYDPSTIRSTFSQTPPPPTPPEKPKAPSLHPAPSVASYATRTSFDFAPEKRSSQPVASSSQVVASSSQHPVQPTERRMSRSSERTQTGPLATNTTRPASISSSVPFPATESADRGESFPLYDYSPLSASSMMANPPTPYNADTLMPATPEVPPPPLPAKRSQDTRHASVGQTSRQTETFRLVRSPSGHVYATDETIVAGGTQWQVVDTSENKGKLKKSSKSMDRRYSEDRESKDRETKRDSKDRESKDRKDRESKDRRDRESRDRKERESKDRKDRESRDRESSKRDRKRESKYKTELEDGTDHRHRLRSHRHERHDSEERSTSTAMATVGSSDWQREANNGHPDTGKSSRKRSEDRERRSEQKQSDVPSVAPNVNKPQPAPPPPTPGAPLSRPLERHPSISTRPTSQLPSAAEMNAMRAKEAWEMERLWKARSMQGNESNGYASIPSGSTPLMGVINGTGPQSAMQGSSHTAFVVQTPFQSQHSIYHSMPTAPPPIIYASPASIPSMSQQLTSPHTHPHQHFRSDSLSDQKSFLSSIRSPLANPLPDPPRASSYELPPLLDSNRRSTDYWTTYTGVSTFH
ncbi:hypothetical protein Hypma_015739 [Hypsizygus marmoreus]|uniref:Uncharacterized protein n=1 Tax=Hypsizygus marmoreus TaxID=39966 RepID=A0A369K4V4_HYPMA|nr:hypothetical protein Hypma_015739 [Hypsizygus marmoreus]